MKNNAIVIFDGIIYGKVYFFDIKDGVKIIVNLAGFATDYPYAMHIHEFGDLSEGCISCGGHFKKGNQHHGLKTKKCK